LVGLEVFRQNKGKWAAILVFSCSILSGCGLFNGLSKIIEKSVEFLLAKEQGYDRI